MLQLKKFPDIPISTQEEARESRPHPEEPRFRLLAQEEGSFQCVLGKEFPAFPSHLQWRRSPQESREDLHGRSTFPESPRCLSPFQGTLFPSTASTFKPRIDSHQGGTWDSSVGKPREKASWESLRGNSLIPCSTRREARHCCYRSGGKRTCMPPLETRSDSPGETPEVPQDPCQH